MQTFMEETKEKVKENQSLVQRNQSLAMEEMNSGTMSQENYSREGLPTSLKFGIEKLSGLPMDDVIVHYNSSKPAQMKALAYTQGTDIHVAPGQERHLGHEAWHVVQQKQGRVKPTTQMKGINVNDDSVLEKEADVMGKKAVQLKIPANFSPIQKSSLKKSAMQRKANQDLPVQYLRVYYLENGIGNIIQSSAQRAGNKRAKGTVPIFDLNGLKDRTGNTNMLGTSENMLIVSHGEKPDRGFFAFLLSFLSEPICFAGFTPQQLASIIVSIIPNGYTGEIYLDGCYTGVPIRNLLDGSSFAEQFGTELKNKLKVLGKNANFTVKGNLGACATLSSGKEAVRMDDDTKKLVNERNKIYPTSKNAYKFNDGVYDRQTGKETKMIYHFKT